MLLDDMVRENLVEVVRAGRLAILAKTASVGRCCIVRRLGGSARYECDVVGHTIPTLGCPAPASQAIYLASLWPIHPLASTVHPSARTLDRKRHGTRGPTPRGQPPPAQFQTLLRPIKSASITESIALDIGWVPQSPGICQSAPSDHHHHSSTPKYYHTQSSLHQSRKERPAFDVNPPPASSGPISHFTFYSCSSVTLSWSCWKIVENKRDRS
jgi:hypothetical protein